MKKSKEKHLWQDFKKFISKGNVIDMAVGVIMGGAFGAIVSTVVNILLTVCTWGIPGGISGLVTVLPAITENQKLPQSLIDLGLKEVINAGEWAGLLAGQQGLYILHGSSYYYKALPIIDWGAFLTAVINFMIIALVLFVILKIFSYLKAKRKEAIDKTLEAYYSKHPNERPIPEEPGKPKPTELEVLMEIRDSIKKGNNTSNLS